jgi:hypothetical protein
MSRSTRIPPPAIPQITPRPITTPYTPTARARSSASRTVARMIASTCGAMNAAVAPWRNRAAISSSALGASPHSSEVSVNPPTPYRNTTRCPVRSPSRAPAISSAPNAIT